MALITTKQKAEELGIDPATLWRWVKAEKIEPAMTLANGAMLFEPSVVRALENYTQEENEK
jgi:predicted site-specific integrase-resolvase